MLLDAIQVGHNPPYEVNVLIEVPVGGETHPGAAAATSVTAR
jgi:hypothetical protein